MRISTRSLLEMVAAFLKHDRGQMLVMAALFLPVMLGFTGLSIDVGMLMVHRTERQRTADAAALAGAQRLVIHPSGEATDVTESYAKQAACDYAQKNGYGTGTCANNPDDEVKVYLPPQTGDHVGDHAYIEVQIKRTDNTFFLRVLGVNDATIGARAVGGSTPLKRNYALIVLDPTMCDSFATGSNITINGGGMIVDSNATTGGNCVGEAALQNGGSVISAQQCKDADGNVIDCTLDHIATANWTISNNSIDTPAPTSAPFYPDPLACPGGSQVNVVDNYCPRPVPCQNLVPENLTCVPISTTACGNNAVPCDPTKLSTWDKPNTTSLSGSGDVTLQPGTYYGGLKVNSTSLTVHFTPGIYVFAGSLNNANPGGFSYQSGNLCGIAVTPGSCPVGSGVTFFNTGAKVNSSGKNAPCGPMTITGSGLLKLTAPTVKHTLVLTGYKDMLFWQDDTCTATFKYAGSSSGTAWTVTGIMYFPKAAMQVTGGGDFGSVQIIVNSFNQGGSQAITINYTRFVDTDRQQYKLVE